MRKVEAPTLIEQKNKFHDSYETHPAFGVVEISNVHSSEGQVMFGSDFKHRSTIQLRVYRANLCRSLSHDWIHPQSGKALIEIELTESQWASVISNPNRGEGLPCTIQQFDGVDLPAIAQPPDRDAQFKTEMDAHTETILRRLGELVGKVGEMKITQSAKNSILDELRMIRQEITANIPFVVQSASEHVEANKERALTDIHAHLSRSLAAVDAAVALELGREALIATGHTAARSFIDVVDVEEGHQS